MQNLVVLIDPSIFAFDVSSKAGNMLLNRFCIDEDAAFELSEVKYFKKGGPNKVLRINTPDTRSNKRKKGKDYSFIQSFIILSNLIFMNN